MFEEALLKHSQLQSDAKIIRMCAGDNCEYWGGVGGSRASWILDVLMELAGEDVAVDTQCCFMAPK